MSDASLAPYDAVLIASFGGPYGPDDVLPFLRNTTAGRDIPDERLAVVGRHYALFGGVSPINAQTEALRLALASELASRGIDVPVVVGNRNWTPYLRDTLTGVADAGGRRVVTLLTSAYSSYSSCRQYRENLYDAASGLDVEVDKIGPYAESSGFVTANADALVDAITRCGVPDPRVVFVTHSIPQAMEDASGPGPADLRYLAEHRRVADAVAREASERLGAVPDYEIAFCSRSGPPRVPWLAPDINDRLRELADSGVRDVVIAPIGFVSDHMEVVYDLDTEAAAAASSVGIRMQRAATAGVHPAFVSGLADRLVRRAAVARGELGEPDDERYRCPESCCLSGRPGQPRPTSAADPTTNERFDA